MDRKNQVKLQQQLTELQTQAVEPNVVKRKPYHDPLWYSLRAVQC